MSDRYYTTSTAFLEALAEAGVTYIFANLAGNRKVATVEGGEKDAALQLQPPPGKALLVVFREGFVAKLARETPP